MAGRLIPVPREIATTAAKALGTRNERGGGGTARGIVIGTALSTGFVRVAELTELQRWHATHPDEVQGEASTLLGGLYGGADARVWRPLTAAARNPSGTGTMLALPVPDAIAEQIARPDGEPTDSMHLTLFSFGDADDLDEETADQIIVAVGSVLRSLSPPTVELSHVERFSPTTEGLEPVALVADEADVYAIRQSIQEALDAAEVTYADNHAFRAHVTIGYYPTDEGPATGTIQESLGLEPLTWTPDRIDLHWGTEVTPLPLPTPVPVTAAARSPLGGKLAKLSAAVARSDRQLATRLHSGAEVAFREAMRAAGVKLKTRVRRSTNVAQAAVTAALDDLNDGHGLPPALLAAVGVTESDLLDRRFDAFEAAAVGWITAAERRKLAAAAQALDLDPDRLDEQYGATIDTRAAAAAGMLTATLGVLARQALSGHAVTETTATGEYGGPVPFGLIRSALQVAQRGATPALPDTSGPGPGGIDTLARRLPDAGDTIIRELLGDLPVQVRTTWGVGAPDRPFEPHQNLDGVSWVDTQPPELDWDPAEFPFVEVLQPGDHDGCECELVEEYEPYDATEDDTESDSGDLGSEDAGVLVSAGAESL